MSWRDILTIEAEADPIVTIRIAALVAVNNSIPVALTAIDLMNGTMQIIVELRNIDERKATYLARKIEAIPTVNSVYTSRIWRRDRAVI
ncbi:MAG: hypothetical protein M3O62_17770 [Pseudomonadota bacterium]|nr:hypothetical protein [Pseudomonadota bacterium]